MFCKGDSMYEKNIVLGIGIFDDDIRICTDGIRRDRA